MLLIVTRPLAQADAWVQGLRGRGVCAAALPLIGIAPPDEPTAVVQAWRGLERLALVIFVSANAVEQFFALRPLGSAWPAALRAGATGPGTTAALLAAGLAPQQIIEPAADAPTFDSEALWAALAREPWHARRVLIVRGEQGRHWLAERFDAQGAEVSFVAAYQRFAPQLGAAQQALLGAAIAAPASHLWIFSSSEALAHLGALAPGVDWAAARALATHPRIAQATRALGFGRVEVVVPRMQAVAAVVRGCADPSVQSVAP